MAQGLQRHLLQVKYVDSLLGELIARLKAIDVFDDALIIVTADHGASFKMGEPRRSTTPQNLPEIAGVPLFVKYPGQTQGAVSEAFVETVDIVPTIADVLEIVPPWELDGFSLKDPSAPVDRIITVRSTYGQPMYLEQEFLQEREWLLDFKAEWFGANNHIDNLFALGPGGIFLGKPVTELATEADERLSATLKRPAQYERVYLRIPYPPSRVLGRVQSSEGELANNQTILIAINGVVHGSGVLFTKDGEDGHFSVMVPSAPFKTGANTVEVFLMRQTESEMPTIASVTVVSPDES